MRLACVLDSCRQARRLCMERFMTTHEWPIQPPRRILLATDLGSHSDRALDRAAQLAGHWQAALHVVHALRPPIAHTWWPSKASDFSVADGEIKSVERQIRRDLRDQIDDLHIHVDTGEPERVILDTAARHGCELIIMGASSPTFAGVVVNPTSAQLLRRAPQSILIVKARPHGGYRRVLIGTDYTDESRHGLKTAAGWFADAELALMHVLDIPYKSLLLDGGRGREIARMERATMADFVAETHLPQALRRRIQTHVEYGYPEIMLRQHGIDQDIDLTVIGALRRGLAFHIFIGS